MVKVALLARSPVIGQVKQRLAKQIGAAKALECYRSLLQNSLEATDPFMTVIWYEGSGEVWTQIAPGRSIRVQPPGDLGHKMFIALKEGAKLVVGADVPLMNFDYIHSALDYLNTERDVVIGPTEDGGYCLIGMSEPNEALFGDIFWGSDRVLDQTLMQANELDLNVALLPELWDVDTMTDYQRWVREISQKPPSPKFES